MPQLRERNGRWGKKNTLPEKISDSREVDSYKRNELFYTSENLTDAKKSETHDAIVYALGRIKDLRLRATKLRGASPGSKAHVEEIMAGGGVMALEEMLDWLRARHLADKGTIDGSVLDRN